MLCIRPLSKELQAKAIDELNEDPTRIENDLKALRAWLAKTPYLKTRTDDQFLVNFLRGCKFSLERTKEKLDMYYTIRAAVPELFANRIVTDEVMDLIKLGMIVPLPRTTNPADPRIILVRAGCYDPEKVDVFKLFKATTFVNDIMFLEDDNFVVAGTVNVMDGKGGTMTQFRQFTPTMMKKIAMASQDANPVRIKGIFYVNMPSFFASIFNVFKVFLKEKTKSRINILGDEIEPLYTNIPQKLLPKEYGGDAGSIDEITDYWVKKVREYKQFFIDEEQYGTDEKKRPGRPKNAETLFGLEGSFRQLEFD